MHDPTSISKLISEDPDFGTDMEPNLHSPLYSDSGPDNTKFMPSDFGTNHSGEESIEQKLEDLLSADEPTEKVVVGAQPLASKPHDSLTDVHTVDERKDPKITSKKQLKFFQLAAAGKLSQDRQPKGVPVPNKKDAKRVLAKHKASGEKVSQEYSRTRHARYKNRRRGLKGRPGMETESKIQNYIPVSDEFLNKLDDVLNG